MQKKQSLLFALMFMCATVWAQNNSVQTGKDEIDSLYIQYVEDEYPAKVLHAEPLYIDLIRDLGARKGEREWNLGMGITDKERYDTYETLIEYEFAPINRLGFEVEVPVTFSAPLEGTEKEDMPPDRIESIKLATQWSFLVKPKYNLSAAIGYINEFVFVDVNKMRRDNIIEGNVFNPFLIVAKRWGSNFHTLVYTGPIYEYSYATNQMHSLFAVNANIHYMIRGTKNFIGVEFNKEFHEGDFDMTIRPQLRVSVAENLLVGIVGGIPINREEERFSSFLRIIWEPSHKH